VSKKRQKLQGEIARFLQQYGRKRQKGQEPNDRRYDKKIQREIDQLTPEALEGLLDGEDN
jgi:hypothetical protein